MQRRFFLPLIIGLTAISGSLFAEQQKTTHSARDYYEAGLRAIELGKADEAKLYLEAAAKLAPGDGNVKAALLSLSSKKDAMTSTLKKNQLSSVVIPELKLDEADIHDSLTAMSLLIEEAAGAEKTPNFVVSDPENKFAGRTATLQLKSIPANAALDFILRAVNGKASFGEYAITITPR